MAATDEWSMSPRTEFLWSIIGVFMETGLGYWATVFERVSGDPNTYKTFLVEDEALAEVMDNAEAYAIPPRERRQWAREALEDAEDLHTLDTAAVDRGIRRITTGIVEVNPGLKAQVFLANENNDATNIDATLSDAIIQAGLFGTLVYG